MCLAGIGKSTLLNLIAGTLEPTKGHIARNPKVPHPLCFTAVAPATTTAWHLSIDNAHMLTHGRRHRRPSGGDTFQELVG